MQNTQSNPLASGTDHKRAAWASKCGFIVNGAGCDDLIGSGVVGGNVEQGEEEIRGAGDLLAVLEPLIGFGVDGADE